jgi:predicted TIM-barrel fold metal-dependent hydrolase
VRLILVRQNSFIKTAKNNPNMILIGSAISVNKVGNAIKELGNERVMFGSDTPFAEAKAVLTQYRRMLRQFDEKTMELVLGGNAKRIFTRKL